MVINTTEKIKQEKIVGISVFLYPKEKQKIVEKAREENRSISNFCKLKLMEAISQN